MAESEKLNREDLEVSVKETEMFIDNLIREKYATGSEKTLDDILGRISDIVEETCKNPEIVTLPACDNPLGKQAKYKKFNYSDRDIVKMQNLLQSKAFIPGGSILAGLTKDQTRRRSLSNCYIISLNNDSIESIFQCMSDAARTYSYRGGCGIDITTLRPENTKVSNAANTSSGAVSFLPMISTVNATIGVCLTGDTWVLTYRGLVKMKDVTTRDLVLSRHGWKRIVSIAVSEKPIYKLTTKSGYQIQGNAEEPFLVPSHKFAALEEKELSKFQSGELITLLCGKLDSAVCPVVNTLGSGELFSKTTTDSLAYLSGYLTVAQMQQSVDEQGRYYYPLSGDRRATEYEPCSINAIQHLAKLFVNPDDKAHHCWVNAKRTSVSISQEVSTFIKANDLLNYKHIPEKIYRSSPTIQLHYLAGLFDGCGVFDVESGLIRFSLYDETHAQEIQKLLLAFGIPSKRNAQLVGIVDSFGVERFKKYLYTLSVVMTTIADLGYDVKPTKSWLTAWTPKMIGAYPETLGVDKDYQFLSAQQFEDLQKGTDLLDPEENILLLDQVDTLEELTGSTERVYDIRLEEEHYFWADGFYAHNCGRRSAMMVSMDCRHPDLMSFIWCKSDPEAVFMRDHMAMDVTAKDVLDYVNTHPELNEEVQKNLRALSSKGSLPTVNTANISVKFTDEFMDAVVHNDQKPWTFYFPDIEADKEFYNEHWDGDYEHWKELNGPLVGYQTYRVTVTARNYKRFIGRTRVVDFETRNFVLLTEEELKRTFENGYPQRWELLNPTAREIFTEVAEAAWTRGDPGVLFWDEHKRWSNFPYLHKSLTPITTNPCYSLDTKIAVADGRGSVTLQQLIDEGKDVPVYTRDLETGRVTIEMGRHPRVTRETAKMVRITFNTGDTQDVTADHPFPTFTGEKKLAEALTSGDLLYSMQRVCNDTEDGCTVTMLTERSSQIFDESTKSLEEVFAQFKDTLKESDGKYIRKCEVCGKEFTVDWETRETAVDSEECALILRDKRCPITSISWSLPITVKSVELIADAKVGTLTVDNTHLLCTMTEFSNPKVENYIVSAQCGEIAGYSGASCNLGAHVVSKYVADPYSNSASFAYGKWYRACCAATLLMNFINDYNEDLHPLKEQRVMEKFAKRIGIEFTGLADALSMLNCDYGSKESVEITERIMLVKAVAELVTSISLARASGPCPACDPKVNRQGIKAYLESPYVRNLIENYNQHYQFFEEILYPEAPTIQDLDKVILKHGLRNVALNTVGPTGSLSILADNCSSGIEPVFALLMKRNTRVGEKKSYNICHAPVAKILLNEWDGQHGLPSVDTIKKLLHVREAHEIEPSERIAMQAAVQKYTDSSISSTVNLPSDCTPQDIVEIYLEAYKKELKGITVFRDGCLNSVIEVVKPEKKKEKEDKCTTQVSTETVQEFPHGHVAEMPFVCTAYRHEVAWQGKKFYVIVSVDEHNNPMEIFTSNLPREVAVKDDVFDTTDYNEKISTWMGLTRVISVSLRAGVNVKEIIKQLDKAAFTISSMVAILARVLKTYVKPEHLPTEGVATSEEQETLAISHATICPKCGQRTYVRKGGCLLCINVDCGYSKCD